MEPTKGEQKEEEICNEVEKEDGVTFSFTAITETFEWQTCRKMVKTFLNYCY